MQRELDNYYQRDRYPPVDQRLPWAAASVAALVLLLGAVAAYRRQRLGPLARSEARWAYLFISPWVVGFLLLTLGPMLASLYFSFTHYTVLSEPRWVGLANYAHMLGEDRDHVAKAFFNALYLAAAGVPLGLATGLAIALLLNGAVRGMRLYRTLFYMPAIVPTAASAVLWLWVLTGDPTKGLLNAGWHATVTQWLDVPPPGWINSEAWAKPGLVLMGVWGAGSGMILWLAGLKGVPTSLYEAASIDGANPRQQFFAVTLPMLSPVILFNAIIGLITVIQEFDRIYIMKAPDGPAGPADSLLTPVFHLFSNGFGYFRMGYASALAWAIFVVILLITLVQLKIAPRWVHYEADR